MPHDTNLSRDDAAIDPPAAPMLRVVRWLFVVFLFSFVFDYKDQTIGFGAAKTGGSLAQYAFLALAMASGGLVTLSGLRFLLVRPAVYMVILWWGYVAFMLVVAVLQGNELGRILRLLLSPLLVGLAINATLIAICMGMRAVEVVKWFLIAGCANVLWKLYFGLFHTGLSITEVRMEVLSPAMNFLYAWVACALLLRRKFTFWILVVLGLALLPAVISITRSIAFPIFASAVGAVVCLAFALFWKMYDVRHVVKKFGAIAGVALSSVALIVLLAAAQPRVAERWMDRLFHNTGGGATKEDLSSLMRKAEAKDMWEILNKDPETFIYGKGLGAGYHWHESFFPELFLVYPADRHQFSGTIYTAGHSIWTYTLFSSGWIGICLTLGAFFYCMFLCLRAGQLNARTVMGKRAPDTYLIFLPLVAMLATLSESITRNPFDERYTGVLFGFMLALPQVFYNRYTYLMHREQLAEITPQLILEEDDVPTDDWNGAFPAVPQLQQKSS